MSSPTRLRTLPQPRTEGIELSTALMANQLAPQQFVDGYVEEIERTLEGAGYYEK
jgi:hypothetical protein